MITSANAIGYKMQADAAIKAIISTRMYHGDVPATITTYPQINFFRVSAAFLEGNAERERWQINCRAKTVVEAQNLAYLVRNCFNEYQGAAGTSFDFNMVHFDNVNYIPEANNIYNCAVDIFAFYIRT